MFNLLGMVNAMIGSYCGGSLGIIWRIIKLYGKYGCWCGLGNAVAETTADKFDAVCRMHDLCYGGIRFGTQCNNDEPYWRWYKWGFDDKNETRVKKQQFFMS